MVSADRQTVPARGRMTRVERARTDAILSVLKRNAALLFRAERLKTLIPTLRIKRRHGTEKGVISFPGDFARAGRGDELFLMQHDADRHKNIKREQGGGKQ